MRLADDAPMPYTAPNGFPSRCRVRVYEPEDPAQDAPVVILSELPDNPGMTITNAAQVVAAEAIERFDLLQRWGGRAPVFIEHLENGVRGTREDPHTFDLVTFRDYDVRETMPGGVPHRTIGASRWRPLDRATVERLVGQRIE